MSDADFNAGVEFLMNSPNLKVSNDTKLALYGYYKQAVIGTCNVKAPSKLKVVENAKWKTWNKLGAMPKEDAIKKYVETLDKAVPDWRIQKSKL